MQASKTSGRKILIREEFCIGCRLCEVYCAFRHSPGSILKAFKKEKEMPSSAIYFEESGTVSFASSCRHCGEAPCLYACPSGALYRDKNTGAVLYDALKCVGCWMCIMSCPYGAIKMSSEKRKVASKCDLCVESGFPTCVEHCPNEAIILVDKDGKRIRK